MRTLVGHVTPSFGFFIIGLWHLFNHIKLYARYPNSYTSPPWVPTSRFKYLELFLIMAGCSASIAMASSAPAAWPWWNHHLQPSPQLRALLHLNDFLGLRRFAIVFDKIGPRAQHRLTQLLGVIVFFQLLLFHLHSTDHKSIFSFVTARPFNNFTTTAHKSDPLGAVRHLLC